MLVATLPFVTYVCCLVWSLRLPHPSAFGVLYELENLEKPLDPVLKSSQPVLIMAPNGLHGPTDQRWLCQRWSHQVCDESSHVNHLSLINSSEPLQAPARTKKVLESGKNLI
ncbi:uncharacterized protein LACBIDRAFT_333953 [Laccaria bicolor S238N-H82]|uniref:Predicted protein n=1 Tax=Laccaria bicolor (strain S238N-H82 / ATCC MYA-4686) TaxID=486041 RepID=B0DXM1_LACBS|nr:uncharacterized protein LACBIDRAFT_333953 [Laccaria bicolor S238N-H82]EDR00642.1 predicted protein [Laccaria bicolor S238N-H82]|eukprot:XP_001888651.1 predicted protein [Laccaria bicolor S238N-H82]